MSTDKKIAKLFSHRVKRFEVNTSGPGRHAPPPGCGRSRPTQFIVWPWHVSMPNSAALVEISAV